MRTIFSVIAISCSVTLLIWISSIYTSAIRAQDLYASRALSHYDLIVDPVSHKANREVPVVALELLRNSPEVEIADPMWSELISFIPARDSKSDSKKIIDTGIEDVAIGTDSATAPYPVIEGKWIANDSSTRIEVVLSQSFSERLDVKVGDQLTIPNTRGLHPKISIIGILEPPPPTITGTRVGSRRLPSPSVAAAFFSLKDARTLYKMHEKITFIAVKLKPNIDIHKFRYRMMPKLYSLSTPVQFMTDADMEEEMSEAAKASHFTLQSFVVGIVSAALAFLVVFSTLSMGVSERIRQFALLRAIVLTKPQLAALICLEGLAIGLMGLMVGILIGWGVVEVFEVVTKGMLRYGLSLSWSGVSIAVATTLIAVFLAGLVPAYRAIQVKPLDAISPQKKSTNTYSIKLLFFYFSVSSLLLLVFPVLSFVYPPSISDPIASRLFIGTLTLTLGLILLAPVLICISEKLFARGLALALRIPPELLQQQLTTQLNRNVTCAITLSVGLGLFATIHTWGWSMVQVFVPSDWAPEATAIFSRSLSEDEIKQFRDEHKKYRLEPLMVEQPRLRDDVLNSAEYPSVTRQMVIVLAGVDPKEMFGGSTPYLNTQWVAGKAEQGIDQMQSNRGLLVPDHFLEQSNMKIGDELFLVPPDNPEKPIAYKIAGSIKLRGNQWMTKMLKMRIRTHRSAGLCFADYRTVASDFDLTGPRHCWIKLSAENTASESENLTLEESFAGIEELTSEKEVALVQTNKIRETVLNGALLWLTFMSVVPLVAMGISSIAAFNMFSTSVRTRYWEFGILRAVGFTRSTIIRVVIAEGILVGFVACILGCCFGLIAGWSGAALSQTSNWFGGMEIIPVIPLTALLIGSAVLVCFSAMAAIWPAFSAGLRSPLKLLTKGRGQE